MAKGDHIFIKRKFYTHHGIDCGDGTVIHYNGNPYQKMNAQICREPIEKFGPSDRIEIKKYGVRLSPEETIERAKSRIGEKRYHLIRNNCEHFA